MMETVMWVVRRFIKHLRARFRMLHLDSKGRAMGVAEHHTRPKSLLLPAYRGSARALQTAAARYAATLAAWQSKTKSKHSESPHGRHRKIKPTRIPSWGGRRSGGGHEHRLENLESNNSHSTLSLDHAEFPAGDNQLPRMGGDFPGSPAFQLWDDRCHPVGTRHELQSHLSAQVAATTRLRKYKS